LLFFQLLWLPFLDFRHLILARFAEWANLWTFIIIRGIFLLKGGGGGIHFVRARGRTIGMKNKKTNSFV